MPPPTAPTRGPTDRDMVFVTTAGNYERDAPMDAYRMLADYLLRS